MVNRLVAVDDADYRLPDPVVAVLASDLADEGSTIGASIGVAATAEMADDLSSLAAATDARIGDVVLPRPKRNPLTGWFHVDGYGAVGDGVADDTAAIQAAIDASRSSTTAGVAGGTVYFPPGEYRITTSLNLYRFAGNLVGSGIGNSPVYTPNPGNASVIRWDGPTTESMIFLRDYKHVMICDLRLQGNDSSKPLYGIESKWLTGDSVGTNAQLSIERVHIGAYAYSSQGTNLGDMKNGIGFTGDNGNNDQFAIRDISISRCEIGIHIPNAQSIWGQIENVLIAVCSVAGIRSAAAFSGFNLNFDYCTVDIIGDSTANIVVFEWNSERSGKLYMGNSTPRLIVYGGRWLLMAPNMAPGAVFVQQDWVTAGGCVHLYDLEISTQLAAPHPKIYIRGNGGGGANGGSFRMIGCKTTMTMTNMDIGSIASNVLDVVIESGQMSVHRRLTTTTTLGAADNRPALAAVATDLATAITLVNDLKAKMISSGHYS